jgi:hypothetical protein
MRVLLGFIGAGWVAGERTTPRCLRSGTMSSSPLCPSTRAPVVEVMHGSTADCGALVSTGPAHVEAA